MINDIILQRLDELIGDYDTSYFKYLLYSYDLSLNECEGIIDTLKDDIKSNKISSSNIVLTLEDYFKSRVSELEKEKKIKYLSSLLDEGSDFYVKYLKKYNLESDEIEVIYSRVESKILDDNISDFEIKRYLEYYFSNAVKQVSYVSELSNIVGKNYDTLLIRNLKRKYPILNDSDIFKIVFEIHGDILEAKDFKSIKDEFQRRCMLKSENKKAQCKVNLNKFVEESGDSFSKLTEFKNLTKRDSDIIISQIEEDISKGLIQPDQIDSVFITKRFNEYK